MDHIWTNLNGLTQAAIVVITLIALVFHVQWTRRNTALGPTFLTTLAKNPQHLRFSNGQFLGKSLPSSSPPYP